jgi:hypothetical protein
MIREQTVTYVRGWLRENTVAYVRTREQTVAYVKVWFRRKDSGICQDTRTTDRDICQGWLGEKTVAYVRTREQTVAYVTEGFMRTTARVKSANPDRCNSKTHWVLHLTGLASPI